MQVGEGGGGMEKGDGHQGGKGNWHQMGREEMGHLSPDRGFWYKAGKETRSSIWINAQKAHGRAQE